MSGGDILTLWTEIDTNSVRDCNRTSSAQTIFDVFH